MFGFLFSIILFCYRYVPNPVFVVIDLEPEDLVLPTKAYCDVEEVQEV